MQPDLLSLVRSRLPDGRQELIRLAAHCEMPFDTLLKIKSGVTKDPRISSVQKLLDHWEIDVCELPG